MGTVERVDAADRRAVTSFVRMDEASLGHHPHHMAAVNADVKKMMLGFAAPEDWLRGHGAIRSITPVDGTGIVGLGLLTADFDQLPVFPDAQALGLNTSRVTYTPLAELPTATDKARRDAPAIAVCELTNPSS